MKGTFPIEKFEHINTPFYYYDAQLLRDTLKTLRAEADKHPQFVVHYAVKANANAKLLRIIREAGLGADCVSGGEIQAAIQAGFPASGIVYAGVGKSDWEIELGLKHNIFCFNAESEAELEVINEIAERFKTTARVALRINPNVGAHTHANITTGLAENKFGIAMDHLESVINSLTKMKHLQLIGLHFHIGSQILDMGDFEALCNRINLLQEQLDRLHVSIEYINVVYPSPTSKTISTPTPNSSNSVLIRRFISNWVERWLQAVALLSPRPFISNRVLLNSLPSLMQE